MINVKKETTGAWWKWSEVEVVLVQSCLSKVNRSPLPCSTSVTPPATLSERKRPSSNTSEWAGWDKGGGAGSKQQGPCFGEERSHTSTRLSTSFSNTDAAHFDNKQLVQGVLSMLGLLHTRLGALGTAQKSLGSSSYDSRWLFALAMDMSWLRTTAVLHCIIHHIPIQYDKNLSFYNIGVFTYMLHCSNLSIWQVDGEQKEFNPKRMKK